MSPEPPMNHQQPSTNHQSTSDVDVDRLVSLLVDLVEVNTGRRPTANKRWVDSCRLLRDSDGHPVEEIERVMRWATTDEFWRTNILSFPKFRVKFSTLQLQSRRGQRSSGHKPFDAEDQTYVGGVMT